MYLPTRILFLLTCMLLLLSTALTCLSLIIPGGEDLKTLFVDYLDVFIMLGIAPHFLFFCR